MTKLQHYLITLEIVPELRVHSYLMCKPPDSPKSIDHAVHAIMLKGEGIAKEVGVRLIPIILMTPLTAKDKDTNKEQHCENEEYLLAHRKSPRRRRA